MTDAEGAPGRARKSRVSHPSEEQDVENDLAVWRHRVTVLEAEIRDMRDQRDKQHDTIDRKLELLIADKQKRDGALAAGNWITRAFWAVAGGVGAMFFERQL